MTSAASATRPLRRPGRVGVVVLTTAIAVGATLLCFAAGAAAGGTYEFTSRGAPARVDPGTLVGFTLVPVAIGMAVVSAAARRWRWVLSVALVVAPVLALGSIVAMPLQVDFDAPSRAALVAAHVVLAPITVVGLLALRAAVTRRP
jgi:hypothetical protein